VIDGFVYMTCSSCSPWTFHITAPTDNDKEPVQIGRIRKKWGGVLKEALTDADHFSMSLNPTLISFNR